MIDPTDPLTDLAVKAMDTEPIKNFLSPVTAEVGQMMGLVANVARFYMTDNLGRVFTKWRLQREGRTIEDADIRKVMPLLPLAGMVEEDGLQFKWALLLETASVGNANSAAFGQMLSQITPEEARFCDRLWLALNEPNAANLRLSERRPITRAEMFDIADPGLNSNLDRPYYEHLGELGELTEHQQDHLARHENADFMIHNLTRVGLLERNVIDKPGEYLRYDRYKIPTVPTFRETVVTFSLTRFGASFIRAVSPQAARPA
jgi:hypothetical protein